MLCLKRIVTAAASHRARKELYQRLSYTRNCNILRRRVELHSIGLVTCPSCQHLCCSRHVPVRRCSSDVVPELSELEYEKLADETLDSLTELFEDLPERLSSCDSEYDVTFGSGVLTVKVSQSWGTYVINKQVPNKQLWLSSPKSGPKRYDFSEGVWVYKHDGKLMHDLLTTEISEALGEHIDFTICSYGSR